MSLKMCEITINIRKEILLLIHIKRREYVWPQPFGIPSFQPPDPLEPPDPMAIDLPVIPNSAEPQKDNFKEKLLNKSCSINKNYNHTTDKHPMYPSKKENTIHLSDEDKLRIYQPWQHSVVVKLFNKHLAHSYLKTKLADLWKPSEALTLTDLGCNFYIATFNRPKNMMKALHGGPWFVTGNFL